MGTFEETLSDGSAGLGQHGTSFPIVDVVGEWRLLDPDRTGGGFAPRDHPTDRGDDDAVLSPDETWRREVEQVVTIEGSLFEVDLAFSRGDLDGRPAGRSRPGATVAPPGGGAAQAVKNVRSMAALRAGSCCIHQWPSPSSTATSAPHRSAVRRASSSPPV